MYAPIRANGDLLLEQFYLRANNKIFKRVKYDAPNNKELI